MIGRPVSELCSDTDMAAPLYPLTQRYVVEHLHHGKFQGIGYRFGRRWVTSDDDVEAIKDRLRPKVVDLDVERPSGLSPRSRTFPARKTA